MLDAGREESRKVPVAVAAVAVVAGWVKRSGAAPDWGGVPAMDGWLGLVDTVGYECYIII